MTLSSFQHVFTVFYLSKLFLSHLCIQIYVFRIESDLFHYDVNTSFGRMPAKHMLRSEHVQEMYCFEIAVQGMCIHWYHDTISSVYATYRNYLSELREIRFQLQPSAKVKILFYRIASSLSVFKTDSPNLYICLLLVPLRVTREVGLYRRLSLPRTCVPFPNLWLYLLYALYPLGCVCRILCSERCPHLKYRTLSTQYLHCNHPEIITGL